jgi:hypothetical protein
VLIIIAWVMNVMELKTMLVSLLLKVVLETLLVVKDSVIKQLMEWKLESLVVTQIGAEKVLIANQEIHNLKKEYAGLNSALTI